MSPRVMGPILAATVVEHIRCWAERMPDGTAIAAPDRTAMDWRRFAALVDRTGAELAATGIGAGDRVAVVLPDGPELATAFLSIASVATFAPLNPAYRREEFDFYLSDLAAKLLILGAGVDSPARAVARAHGIPVAEMELVAGEPAGSFTLRALENGPRPIEARAAEPNDVALVLHTSGTTSRPKIVPLTHRNLCASAANVRDTLRLTTADRCLNVMPLFHIHGLVAATLASLAAGASVHCAPGFRAPEFFDWLEASKATWYTAVPTMHQAVLARAQENRARIASLALRFIRSSSAPLPVPVIRALEATFSVPVIEAYGMTEAAHQMASNPLPPRARKPGSVGVAAGPEIAIMNAEGVLQPAGSSGEVVIRGDNVMAAYENNVAANADAFSNGWFRTGDQGVLDEDGYLFLTGRLKEIINRGGEKISPREVDDVLHAHPSVAQAVAFAMSHPTLGEDVAAAVVRREGVTVTAAELRAFAAERLAHFKVPARIVFVAEIPKGATGKLQRVGLAERLGIAPVRLEGTGAAPWEPPAGETEIWLAALWQRLLGVERVGALDDFFALGGDSILAATVALRTFERTGVELPLPVLFEGPTLREVATRIDRPAPAESLVVLQRHGRHRPFFCVHERFGEVALFAGLARHLGPEQPFYALQPPGLDGRWAPFDAIEPLASHYIDAIRSVQPSGPYALGGFCAGGLVALEMAQQLRARGESVAPLVMLDAFAWSYAPERPAAEDGRASALARGLPHWLAGLLELTWAQWRELLSAKLAGLGGGGPAPPRERTPSHERTATAFARGLRAYVPQPWPESMILLRARMQPLLGPHDHTNGWRSLSGDHLQVHVVPGNHLGMLQKPHVAALAGHLAAALAAASPAGCDSV